MSVKNCEETPRQKMIAMMYLVYTALLALNVSVEILNAFTTVNAGLVVTNEIYAKKSETLYSEFEAKLAVDEVKVTPFYNKALKAKKYSYDLISYIRDVRTSIVAICEYGVKIGDFSGGTYKLSDADRNTKEYKMADTLDLNNAEMKKDDYDKPMEILLPSSNVEGGAATEIKKRIIQYKKDMLNLLDTEDKKDIHLGMLTEDAYNEHAGLVQSWELNTFYRSVAVADIVMLNRMINEIYNAETAIVTELLGKISAKDFKFDKIGAKVIPVSNYVLQGDKYSADIFVAAYSTTQAPSVLIKTNADTLLKGDYENAFKIDTAYEGVVKYEIPATSLGEHKYAGVINIVAPDGTTKPYHFKSEYIVAKPSVTVSATKMNVFYIGVDNPVSISVPGVASDKIKPSCSGGTLRRKGADWIVRVPRSSKKATIRVSADFGGGKTKSMGSAMFRVRRVPDPVAFIGGKKGGNINRSTLLASGGIIPRMVNFDFDLNFRITSFSFTTTIGGDLIETKVRGNRLSSKVKSMIKNTKRGQKVYIEDIKAKGPDGTTRKLASINLKII